jgi:hypothetical protein
MMGGEAFMRALVLLVFVCTVALGAVCQAQPRATQIDLQGTWQFSLVAPHSPNRYTGTIIVDSFNTVWGVVQTPHGVVTETGNVTISENYVDVIFTSADASKNNGAAYRVDRFHCIVPTQDKLACRDITDGEEIDLFLMSRVK